MANKQPWTCLASGKPAPCGYELRKLAWGWWYHNRGDKAHECHHAKHRKVWMKEQRRKQDGNT